MRMRLERVPEKDDSVDPALGYRRANLLIPSQRAAQEGVPVTTVAAQLGHSRKSMTLDTYSHVLVGIDP